jgi:hypothetical protein
MPSSTRLNCTSPFNSVLLPIQYEIDACFQQNQEFGFCSIPISKASSFFLSLESSEQAGAELALHFRLYNYSVKSGAPEDKIKSFIAKVSSGDFSPEKVIELA